MRYIKSTRQKTTQISPAKQKIHKDRRHIKAKRPSKSAAGLRLFARLTLVGGAVAFFMGLVQSGWVGHKIDRLGEKAMLASSHMGFGLEEIMLEGRLRTSASAIVQKLDFKRGDPLLQVSLQQTRQKIENLEWVENAFIQRRLPNTLYIKLDERQPLALWQNKDGIFVIDQQGVIIKGADLAAFDDLVIVAGEDAPQHTSELLDILFAYPKMASLVRGAVRVGARRWNIHLSGGIDIQLPERNPEKAWSTLVRIIPEYGLLEKDIAIIDLRLPDRMIVRTLSEENTLMQTTKEDKEI